MWQSLKSTSKCVQLLIEHIAVRREERPQKSISHAWIMSKQLFALGLTKNIKKICQQLSSHQWQYNETKEETTWIVWRFWLSTCLSVCLWLPAKSNCYRLWFADKGATLPKPVYVWSCSEQSQGNPDHPGVPSHLPWSFTRQRGHACGGLLWVLPDMECAAVQRLLTSRRKRTVFGVSLYYIHTHNPSHASRPGLGTIFTGSSRSSYFFLLASNWSQQPPCGEWMLEEIEKMQVSSVVKKEQEHALSRLLREYLWVCTVKGLGGRDLQCTSWPVK